MVLLKRPGYEEYTRDGYSRRIREQTQVTVELSERRKPKPSGLTSDGTTINDTDSHEMILSKHEQPEQFGGGTLVDAKNSSDGFSYHAWAEHGDKQV